MSVIDPDIEKTVFAGLVGSMLAFFGWFGSRRISVVDKLETRVGKLERESVTREDLDKTVRSFNKTASNTHSRIDDIFKLLNEQSKSRIGGPH